MRHILTSDQRRLLLLRVLLGLEPVGNQLLVDPGVPKAIERLELLDIPGRWARTDAIGRGHLEVTPSGGRMLPFDTTVRAAR